MSLYIFGYGSLIYAPGINDRTKQVYTDNDLHEARLYGYKREWNAVWSINDSRYLGVVSDDSSYMNGVIFKLPEDCFDDFAKTEGSESHLYDFVNVRHLVIRDKTFPYRPEDRVLTCVTANPSDKGTIPSYYIDVVEAALKVRGVEFAKEFWETTPKPDCK